MANVIYRGKKKDGTHSFKVRVFVGTGIDGKKQYYSTTFTCDGTYKEKTAKKKADAYAINLEKEYKDGKVSNKSYKFQEYALLVLDTKERAGELKHSTAERYKDSLNKVSSFIGNIKLKDLRPEHLDQMYKTLMDTPNKRTGKPISSSTIHEHHTLIHMVLEKAYKNGYVVVNVADRATPPKRNNPEVLFYTEEEVKDILDKTKNCHIKWRLVLQIFIMCGLRKGELCGLKWESVNLENATIRVCNQVQHDASTGELYEETPKTKKSNRTIAIDPITVNMFKEYKAWQNSEKLRLGAYYVDKGFVFSQDNGNPMHPDSINNKFSKMEKAYNLPHLRPHSFRHTMATQLFAENVDAVTISSRLGHAQVSTTADIYAHAIAKRDEKCADVLAKVYKQSV